MVKDTIKEFLVPSMDDSLSQHGQEKDGIQKMQEKSKDIKEKGSGTAANVKGNLDSGERERIQQSRDRVKAQGQWGKGKGKVYGDSGRRERIQE